MSEIVERVREDIWQILHNHEKPQEWSGVVLEILSHKNIAIIDPDAELPKSPYMVPPRIKSETTSGALGLAAADSMNKAYNQAQQDMKKAGWVKRVKNE